MGPLLPGERPSLTSEATTYQLVIQFAALEHQLRHKGQQILRRLHPSDDLAQSVRRVLEALDEC